jgi:hypothetical protein
MPSSDDTPDALTEHDAQPVSDDVQAPYDAPVEPDAPVDGAVRDVVAPAPDAEPVDAGLPCDGPHDAWVGRPGRCARWTPRPYARHAARPRP